LGADFSQRLEKLLILYFQPHFPQDTQCGRMNLFDCHSGKEIRKVTR
jgi:hypothetical protein